MTDRQVTAALAGSATVATTAPALQHSQPWRWVLHTGSLDLFADPRSELSREETLMTCGSAVHRARIALTADGLAVRIDLLPDEDPNHVATLTPVGTVAVSDSDRELVEAAQHATPRPTPAEAAQPHPLTEQRGRTEPPRTAGPGPPRSLADAARAEGARLRTLDRAEAQRLAAATPPLARTARSGVSLDDGTEFAILYGSRATPKAWLRAGLALSAVDLDATLDGRRVVASAAAVAMAGSREVLRRLLPAGATPYLGLRITAAITSSSIAG